MGIIDFFNDLFNSKGSVNSATVTPPSAATKKIIVADKGTTNNTPNPALKNTLKVSSYNEIEKNVQLVKQPDPVELTLFCPFCMVKIFCHSVLIDKLGDLTKFVTVQLGSSHPQKS